MILAEGVDATEFPDLASQFHVQGVPQTVINSGTGTVVGAVPEQNLLDAVLTCPQELITVKFLGSYGSEEQTSKKTTK